MLLRSLNDQKKQKKKDKHRTKKMNISMKKMKYFIPNLLFFGLELVKAIQRVRRYRRERVRHGHLREPRFVQAVQYVRVELLGGHAASEWKNKN